MDNRNFCQSCGMPLDNHGILGTEKYGSLSLEYCRYCYQYGEFTDPNMTLDQMTMAVRSEMEKRSIGEDIIRKTLDLLPRLRRWRKPETFLI